MSIALTRDQIVQMNDMPIDKIPVPEWGGDVYYRALSLAEKRLWEESISGDDKASIKANPEELMTSLLVKSLVTPEGALMFDKEGDIKLLAAKNGAVVTRIYEVIATANGIGTKGREAVLGNSGSPASSST